MRIQSFTTGLMSALLACSGGAIMVVQTASIAGLSQAELLSWFSSVYVIGGLLNLYLVFKYKIPFAGAHSITAIAFIGTIADQFTFSELAGGFVMSGALILIAGFTGWFGKVLNLIPKNLLDALLAGLLLHYVLGIAPAVLTLPVTGLLAGIGYYMFPKWIGFLPPAMWALLLGLLGLGMEYTFTGLTPLSFQFPSLIEPYFSVKGLFSIAIPLAVLIMSNDLAVGLASLKSHEFEPPVNKTLAASGLACMFAALFGGHAANIGGMMSALCSSEEAGAKQTRRWAALISNGIVIGFGLMAWKVIAFIQIMPVPFITMITGLSLWGVFINGLRSAFSNKMLLVPSVLTFGISVMNVNLMGISSPVWALFLGLAAMKALKSKVKGGEEV